MEKVQCHYDVLEVERTADDDTIKKAYRKLALRWHPDKNPTNVAECTRRFALIQHAYDILSDPHEKSWYDRHRENILRGGIDEHYEDNSLNLFPYFTTTCFSGYGNDSKGFYAVYRQVFEILASEDYEFLVGKIQAYPSFGYPDSIYDEVVGPFYAFWGSFCTARSFSWVDKYDTRGGLSRRLVRASEMMNKKLREASKRKRNEEIRELVAFIRKRDPRVEVHKKLLDERRMKQERKMEENRKQRILERLSQVGEYKEMEEVRQSQLANLREIEEALDAEFEESAERNDLDADSNFYCDYCEKLFKTRKALDNHENSRKHKDTVSLVKKHMQEDDACLLIADHKHNEAELAEVAQIGMVKKSKRQKRKERKKHKCDFEGDSARKDSCPSNDGIIVQLVQNNTNVMEKINDEKVADKNISLEMFKESEICGSTKVQRRKEKAFRTCAAESAGPKVGVCDRCDDIFESRTKLFVHLKESGHATLKSFPAIVPTKVGAKKMTKK